MQAIEWVISTVLAISWLFHNIYLEISGWWPPFNYLAGPFLWVSDAFMDLAHYLSQFSLWVYEVSQKIAQVFSWDTILSLIQPYIQWGIDAYNWTENAYNFVRGWIDNWWNETKTTVLGWIDIATQGFNTLKTEWDNFWKVTFPKLIDSIKLETWWSTKLLGIDSLIDSTLKRWFPWYETLVDIKDELFEFFADPLDWVYKKLDEFFERFW